MKSDTKQICPKSITFSTSGFSSELSLKMVEYQEIGYPEGRTGRIGRCGRTVRETKRFHVHDSFAQQITCHK